MITKEKQRAQVKSKWYYIFWGNCTVAVCDGQLFVGSGFRRMSESVDKVLDACGADFRGSVPQGTGEFENFT